jgi:hypothetical protein
MTTASITKGGKLEKEVKVKLSPKQAVEAYIV